MDPKSSEFSCHALSFSVYVSVDIVLPLTLEEFPDSKELDLAKAIANVTSVQLQRITITLLDRRSESAFVHVHVNIAADNTSAAASIAPLITQQTLDDNLLVIGLPRVSSLYISVAVSYTHLTLPTKRIV